MLEGKRERENAYKIAAERNATSEEVARIQDQWHRYSIDARVEADYNLKQMGINTDLVLQEMRNLNAKEIEEIKGNIQTNLENLKHENLVGRMMLEFSNELKLHNYDAKAAMRNVLVNNIAKLIGDGKTPWTKIGNLTAWEIAADIVDKTMAPLLEQFDNDAKKLAPDLSNLGDVISKAANNGGSNETKPAGEETLVRTKDAKQVKEEADLAAGRPTQLRTGQGKPKKEHIKKKGGSIKK